MLSHTLKTTMKGSVGVVPHYFRNAVCINHGIIAFSYLDEKCLLLSVSAIRYKVKLVDGTAILAE